QGDCPAGHLRGQGWPLLIVEEPQVGLHVSSQRMQGAVRGGDEVIELGQLQELTNGANATGAVLSQVAKSTITARGELSAGSALAAGVLLIPADTPPEQLPRLAIHPYPNQYVAPFTLRDGTQVTVRPIRPEDEPLIIDLHGRHSEHTIRMRFFSLVKTLSRDSLIRLCHLDYDREMALAAVLTHDGQPMILGVSRYYLQPET